MASLCFSVRSSSSCAVKKIHRIKCFRNNDQTRRLFSVTCGAMTSLLGRTRRGRHALPCFFLLFPLGDRQASSVVTRNYLLTGEAAGKNKPLADGGGAPLNEARHACGKMSRRHERGKEMARGGRRRKNAAHETSSTRKKPFFPSRNRAEEMPSRLASYHQLGEDPVQLVVGRHGQRRLHGLRGKVLPQPVGDLRLVAAVETAEEGGGGEAAIATAAALPGSHGAPWPRLLARGGGGLVTACAPSERPGRQRPPRQLART